MPTPPDDPMNRPFRPPKRAPPHEDAELPRPKQARGGMRDNPKPSAVMPRLDDVLIVDRKVVKNESWADIASWVRFKKSIYTHVSEGQCMAMFKSAKTQFRSWMERYYYFPLHDAGKLSFEDVVWVNNISYSTDYDLAEKFVRWSKLTTDGHPRDVIDDWDTTMHGIDVNVNFKDAK